MHCPFKYGVYHATTKKTESQIEYYLKQQQDEINYSKTRIETKHKKKTMIG